MGIICTYTIPLLLVLFSMFASWIIAAFIHESGHLFFTFLLIKGKITVNLGTKKIAQTYFYSEKIGRVHLNMDLDGLISDPYNTLTNAEDKTFVPWKYFFISLGGPLFNTISLYYFCKWFNYSFLFLGWDFILNPLLFFSSISALWAIFSTSLPSKDDLGNVSDGYQVKEIARYYLTGFSEFVTEKINTGLKPNRE
jgi:hypothetical protein